MLKQGGFLQVGLVVVGLWIGLPLVVDAETPPETLEITRMEICTSIANKEPQGSAVKFNAGEVSRLYCFTEIVGAKEPTYITHTWYYNDKQIVSIKLAVETRRWRNWSNKTFLPVYKGNWKVEVTDADGKALKSAEFVLE